MSDPVILAIESSCDETAAAVVRGKTALSNVIASQAVHAKYGGVVPELASRAHQSHIVPVVTQALQEAGVTYSALDAIACTIGPGLSGSLLVGLSFAKSLSLALNKPLIGVNHMQAHILAHFLHHKENTEPEFPFLCLTVSGGHTQIIRVDAPLTMTLVGETLDDAAGEAFDKAAKLFGLPYPGGPEIDRLAQNGNAHAFAFTRPSVPGLNFSFSGLKTSLLYFVRDQVKKDADFVQKNLPDLSASFQRAVVAYLEHVLVKASVETGIRTIAVAGGVSANSALRRTLETTAAEHGWDLHIPPLAYCTDNAAMIGIAAHFLFQNGVFAGLDAVPQVRLRPA